MKHIIKKYRGVALLVSMFIFSLHINAVFEGRSEQLKESAGIRTEVELTPFGTEQATGTINPGGNNGTPLGGSPISDAPWIMLFLGLGYGVYAFASVREKRHAVNK